MIGQFSLALSMHASSLLDRLTEQDSGYQSGRASLTKDHVARTLAEAFAATQAYFTTDALVVEGATMLPGADEVFPEVTIVVPLTSDQQVWLDDALTRDAALLDDEEFSDTSDGYEDIDSDRG